MTRKRSNVKALALAVTCAILAGGYSGLNPVYAAVNLYKDATTGDVTTNASQEASGTTRNNYLIGEITNGLTIGGVKVGNTNGLLEANSLKIANLDVTNAITALNVTRIATTNNETSMRLDSLKLGTEADNVTLNKAKVDSYNAVVSAVNDANTGLATKANKTDVEALQTTVGATEDDGLQGKVKTNTTDITNLKTAVGDNNSGLVQKTTNIRYANGTTVDDVTFNAGAVTGVKSINASIDNFHVDNSGNVTAKGNIAASGGITANNYIKAGNSVEIGRNGNTYAVKINKDGIYAGGADANTAKAAIGTNGSLKAGNGNFNIDEEGKLFGTDSNKKISIDQLITDSANIGGITRTKDATSGYTTTIENRVTVDGNGKIGGVSSINDKITITDDKVTIAVGTTNPVEITAEGLKVGTGSAYIADDGFKVGTDGHNTLTAEGLRAKTINAGTNNNEFVVDTDGVATSKGGFVVKPGTEEKFKVDENGNITSKGTLNISGKTIFGDVTGKNVSVDDGDLTATGALKGKTLGIGTSNTQFVVNENGNIIAAGGQAKFGSDAANVSLDAGNLTASGALNGATMNIGSGNLQVLASGETTFGATTADQTVINKGTITANKALKVNDNNKLTTDGLKADKAVIDSISIDDAKITSSATSGALTIAGITLNDSGELSGVKAIDGVSVVANNATTGVTGGLKIGDNAIIGAPNTPFSSNGYDVDKDGNVEGKSFTVKGSANNTKLEDGSLNIGIGNTWTQAAGINATSAKVGSLEVTTSAKFGSSSANQSVFDDKGILNATGAAGRSTVAGKVTTIDGGIITTDTLNVKRIELGESIVDKNGTTISGSKLTVDADGSLKAASGKFQVDKDGQVTNEYTGTDADSKTTKTTFKTSVNGITANYTNSENNKNNLLNIDKNGVGLGVTDTAGAKLGMFSANATSASIGFGDKNSVAIDAKTITSKLGDDVSSVMTNDGNDKSIVDTVGTASRTLKAGSIVDSVDGKTITTNANGTTFANGTGAFTTINGSSVRSYDPATGAGHLNGATLNLYKNNDNATYMTAGGAEFIGDAGEKGGKKTTIKGGTITTDTLNVERINLGGEVIDKGAAGEKDDSKLYMDAQGNFRAASGKFNVAGNDGSMTNSVGNTTLKTDTNGASMSYAGTVTNPDGTSTNVTSEVSVGNDSAKMSTEASSIEVKNDGITNTGKTTFKGTSGETTIDGGTIKTGHLITDKLTITGSGNADGSGSTPGSVAFGADGTIKSDIVDGNDHTTFETTKTGTTTTVTDGNKIGNTITTNEVTASGNTNKVKDVIGNNSSTFTQTTTSIGGVVTNGKVSMRQELTTDGLKISDDKHFPDTQYTQITNKDVSITNPKDYSSRINLSDLGSLGDLNEEITSREEYTSNKTAVGAINAEAGIRREEVARLDGRINDVNDRVNKVGAMAAAIASLKSIGYDPQAPSEFSIGLGQYKGETGVAMGFFHYPNKNFMINVSLSTAGGETMGGIGATWRFGHKSPQKLLEEQRAEQAKKELAAAEKYQAAAKLAKEAQERAEYAAKLARQAQVSADNAKAAADATQAKHF